MTTIDLDRGERNCNPGNIERVAGTQWMGMANDQSGDPRFVVFSAMIYGVRALAKLLLTYQHRRGCDTLRKLIERWAPGVENNTVTYLVDVRDRIATELGREIDIDAFLDLDDRATHQALVRAIIHHENGRVAPFVETLIPGAVDLARSTIAA